MPFFQVQLLRQLTGAITVNDLPEFWAVVDSIKKAGPGIKNAAYILTVDETPLETCNEIPVNAANGSKILQYLVKNHEGKVNPENLVGCAIRFGYREYPEYVDPITGGPQVGLSIKEIEPFDTSAGESMQFDIAPDTLPDWVTEKEPTKAELKRAQLREREEQRKAAAARVDDMTPPKTAPARPATKRKK